MIFFPFYVPWAICFYHLWCLLNKNKHRNSTVASTSPLRLSLSHLSSMLLSYINQSGHLCIGPLHNGNCMCRLQWLTGSCVLLAHAFMPSSYVWGDAEPGCVQKCGFKKTPKKPKQFLDDLLAESLKPLAEWTITCRKPYRPGVSSSGKQEQCN